MKHGIFRTASVLVGAASFMLFAGCGQNGEPGQVSVNKAGAPATPSSSQPAASASKSVEQPTTKPPRTAKKRAARRRVKRTTKIASKPATAPNPKPDSDETMVVTQAPHLPVTPSVPVSQPPIALQLPNPPAISQEPDPAHHHHFFGIFKKAWPFTHKKKADEFQTPQVDPVVGFGSLSLTPALLSSQPLTFQTAQMKSCDTTARMTDGSLCYLLFQDGHTEWLTAINRPAFEQFGADLINNPAHGSDSAPAPAANE